MQYKLFHNTLQITTVKKCLKTLCTKKLPFLPCIEFSKLFQKNDDALKRMQGGTEDVDEEAGSSGLPSSNLIYSNDRNGAKCWQVGGCLFSLLCSGWTSWLLWEMKIKRWLPTCLRFGLLSWVWILQCPDVCICPFSDWIIVLKVCL